MGSASLLKIADLYIYADSDDWSFSHLMSDPRSKLVSESEAEHLWDEGDAAPMPNWRAGTKGVPCSAWASLHFYKNNIDFDYLDIGANLSVEGIAQAILFKRCSWGKRVYLFEPGEVRLNLERSLQLNRVDDIGLVVNAAVSDKVGKQLFYVLPNASGGSSLLVEKLERIEIPMERVVNDVETTTVDQFVIEHLRSAPALVVKIDTEGNDFKVLEGMRHVMSQRMVVIQAEFIPDLIETYASPGEKLAELMQDNFIVSVGSDSSRRLISVNNIDAFVSVSRQLTIPTDICLIPRRLPEVAVLLECILCG